MNKEIMPVYSQLLIEFYEENPYELKETESGLKLTNDLYENPDSGNLEKKDFFIRPAKVISAGPDCKFIHEGDDVLLDTRSCRPLRFYDRVFFVVPEQTVLAVIADGLTERFEKNGK